jgi:hypothetical protein
MTKNHTIVYVDIDETLVKTKRLYNDTDQVPEGWTLVQVTLAGKQVRAATVVRPSAKAFLEELNRRYEVHALTSGGCQFQDAVLQSVGLRHLIGTIYGGDSEHDISPPEFWVLVDDLKGWMSGVESKFMRLGYFARNLKCSQSEQCRLPGGGHFQGERWQAVVERHLINCELFFGAEDKQALTDLLPEIESRMYDQSTPLPFDPSTRASN